MSGFYLFDIDGTLCDRDEIDLYPQAENWFSAHRGANIALVTNQGGPACHDAGWDFSNNFPSLEVIEARIGEIATKIEELTGKRPLVLVSLVYQKKNNEYIFPINVPEGDPRLTIDWRKPHAGMLVEAMAQFDASPYQVVMVGDQAVDQLAAQRAGCQFEWAKDFFSLGDE